MLKESHIMITQESLNADQALERIGMLLYEVGSVSKKYINNMIDSYHSLGAYFVIAPGVALAHAKPDSSVLQNDIALMVCKKPVIFNSHNDPVTLVFGLCATSGDHHMDKIVDMANLLDNQQLIEKIKKANDSKEIEDLLKQA